MATAVASGRRKCHYTLPDESEVVEEFDMQTDELLVRKKRGKSVLGALEEWKFEVGEPPSRVTIENDMLRPSSSNPVLVRKDRPHAFESGACATCRTEGDVRGERRHGGEPDRHTHLQQEVL